MPGTLYTEIDGTSSTQRFRDDWKQHTPDGYLNYILDKEAAVFKEHLADVRNDSGWLSLEGFLRFTCFQYYDTKVVDTLYKISKEDHVTAVGKRLIFGMVENILEDERTPEGKKIDPMDIFTQVGFLMHMGADPTLGSVAEAIAHFGEQEEYETRTMRQERSELRQECKTSHKGYKDLDEQYEYYKKHEGPLAEYYKFCDKKLNRKSASASSTKFTDMHPKGGAGKGGFHIS